MAPFAVWPTNLWPREPHIMKTALFSFLLGAGSVIYLANRTKRSGDAAPGNDDTVEASDAVVMTPTLSTAPGATPASSPAMV